MRCTHTNISISSGRVSVKHHKSSIEVARLRYMVSSERIYHIPILKNVYSFTVYITINWEHRHRKAVCEMRRKVEGEKRLNHCRLRGLEIIGTLNSLIYRYSAERSIISCTCKLYTDNEITKSLRTCVLLVFA